MRRPKDVIVQQEMLNRVSKYDMISLYYKLYFKMSLFVGNISRFVE